ncbi:MAG: hypothetical protein OHK0053_26960 [Microscillaceae bacterium]
MVFLLGKYYTQAQQVPNVGDVGVIVNELNTRVVNPNDSVKQFIELLVVGCPGRGTYTGNDPDQIGPDPSAVDLRGWILDDNNGDFGGADGVSDGHIRFSNHPVWAAVPVGSIILIYNREGFMLSNTFIDDPNDTSPNNRVYILGVGDQLGGRPLFVEDLSNNTYGAYTVGDAQPDVQGTYSAATIDTWDRIRFLGTGDAIQTRDAGAAFFHGVVWGTLSGGALAPNNGTAVPAATQGVNLSGQNATNADVFFDHQNADAVPLDNYRHKNNYTIQPNANGTPGLKNTTTGDRNGILISNLRSSLDAGPQQVVCGVESSFNPPTGGVGFWDATNMWRFTGNFNAGASVFNIWEYVSGPDGLVNPANAVIIQVNDPNSRVLAQAGPGVYVFRRQIPDELLATNPGIEYCIDADTVQITFLGTPDAFAGNDFGVCSDVADLLGDDRASSVIFNGSWEYVIDSGPVGAPAPVFIDDLDGQVETQRVQVSQPGTYTFRWRVGSEDCPDVDLVRVTFAFGSFAPNAGPDQSVCGLGTTLQANPDPSNAAYWTVSTNSPTQTGINFSGTVYNPADPLNPRIFNNNPAVTVPVAGVYEFIWNYGFSEGSVNCLVSDTVQVRFVNVAGANAGPDQVVCGFTTTLTGTPAVGGSIDASSWSLISAPGGATPPANLPANNQASVGITVTTPGEYTFRYSINGTENCTNSNDVVVFFVVPPIPQADPLGYCGLGGSLQAYTDGTTNGNNFNIATDEGTWTLVSGPGTLTIDDPNDPETTISAISAEGIYTFQWEVARTVTLPSGATATCTESIQVQVSFVEIPVAVSSTVADSVVVCGAQYVLEGNVDPEAQGQWRAVPGDVNGLTVTFTPDNTANNATVTVTNNPGGVSTFNSTVRFIWQLSKADPLTGIVCASEDTIAVRFIALPEPIAQSDTICGFTTNLTATNNLTAEDTGTWSLVGQPLGVNPADVDIDNVNNPGSPVTVNMINPVEGTYTFRWNIDRTVTLANGETATCPAFTEIDIYFATIPIANAGADIAQVCGNIASLGLDAANNPISDDPAADLGIWEVASDTTGLNLGGIVFANPNAIQTTATLGTTAFDGTITFSRTLFNIIGTGVDADTCQTTDLVDVTFVSTAVPDAGPDDLSCGLNNYALAANTVQGASGVWTLVSGPGTPTFTNANDPTSTVSVSAEGLYTFAWSLTKGTCPAETDEVSITFLVPPVSNAGPDVVDICNFTTNLAAQAVGAGEVGTWTQTGGPATATIQAPNNPNSPVTVPNGSTGTYTFTWTVTRDNGSGTQVCPVADVTSFTFINQPLTDAGPDQLDICFNDTQTATLAGNTPAAGFAGQWSLISGPTGSSFDTPSSQPNAIFRVTQSGIYVLNWSVTGGIGCQVDSTVTIRFTDLLNATVANPADVCGLTTSLQATDGFPIGQWTASPAAGVVFTNETAPTTSVTVPAPGNYTFTWTIGNGTCQDQASTNAVQFFPELVNPSVENDDIVVYLGNTVELVADGGPDATYTWSPTTNLSNPNIANPVFTAASPTPSEIIYNVTMTTGIAGATCTVVIPVRVRVFTELNVPNVFTPNGDGRFDTWEIPLLTGFPNAKICVFNRWGDQVFESTGYQNPWDGTFNSNPVGHGTYYWTIDLNNGQAPEKGYVVVTR